MSQQKKAVRLVELESVDDKRVYTDRFLDNTTKRVSKGSLYCETGIQRDEYIISYITVILFLISLGFDVYLLIKYSNQFDASLFPFISSVWTTISFLLIGFVLHWGFVNRNLSIEEPKLEQLFTIGVAIGIGFAVTSLNALLGSLRYAVLPYEYFLFFLTVAIAEEILWRAGFQPALKVLFNFVVIKKTTKESYSIEEENRIVSRLLSSGMAILVTAGMFTLMHIFVYTDPTQLWIVFIMGVIFGTSLELTRRVDFPIIIHLVVNFVGGLPIIIQYFGGF